MKGIALSFSPKQAVRACLKYVRNAMSFIANIPLLNKVVRPETQASDAVIKRLSRMKETHGKKEQAMSVDPFKRTFLEKTRESLECGSSYDNREHMLRTKLQWFAGSEWSKQEIEHVVDKALKNSQRQVLKASLKNTNPRSENFPQFTPVFETVTVGPNRLLKDVSKIIREEVLENNPVKDQSTNRAEFSAPNFVIIKNEGPPDCVIDAKALETLFTTPVIKLVSDVRATAIASAVASPSATPEKSIAISALECNSDLVVAESVESAIDLPSATVEAINGNDSAITVHTINDSAYTITNESINISDSAASIDTVVDWVHATTDESTKISDSSTSIDTVNDFSTVASAIQVEVSYEQRDSFEQPEVRAAAANSYIESKLTPVQFSQASLEIMETGFAVLCSNSAVQYSAAASASLTFLNSSVSVSEPKFSVTSIEAPEGQALCRDNLNLNLDSLETLIEASDLGFKLDDSLGVQIHDLVRIDFNWDESLTHRVTEEQVVEENHPYICENSVESEELLDFAPEISAELASSPSIAEPLVDTPSSLSLKFAAVESEITLPTYIEENTKTAILENLGAGINLSTTQVSLRVSQNITAQKHLPEADFSITIITPEASVELEQPKLSTSTALMGRITSTSLVCLNARKEEPVVQVLEPVEIECEIAVVKFVDQASQRMRMLFAVHDLSMFGLNGSLARSTGVALPSYATT